MWTWSRKCASLEISNNEISRPYTLAVIHMNLKQENKPSRRVALHLAGALLVGLGLFTTPTPALAEPTTSQKLSQAQSDYAKAQEKLERLADQISKASEEQSETLNQIEEVKASIAKTEASIAKEQKMLEARQQVLSKRISQNYKNGPTRLLSIIMESSSFDELTSNLYYFDKISGRDKELIQQVKDSKAALDQKKDKLEAQKLRLSRLATQQQQELDDIRKKQQECQEYVDGLSSDVQSLMAQRDEELAAAQRAAEEARKNQNNSHSNWVNESGGSGSLSSVLSAANSVGSPGTGLCAMWVSQVFSAAGLGYPYGNANDMYNYWCHSSNQSQIKPGMIVAVSSHPHTMAGRIYGHVGIYVGGGMVMDNIGYIRTIPLSQWISYYGGIVTPRWGWVFGKALS